MWYVLLAAQFYKPESICCYICVNNQFPCETNISMNCITGIKESDTGLAAPSQWDLVSDKQMMQEEQPLQVHFQRV